MMQIVWRALGPCTVGLALHKGGSDHRPVVRVVGTRPGRGSRERDARKDSEHNSGPGKAGAATEGRGKA